MSANQNWRRWIHASVAKKLTQAASDSPLDISTFVEGIHDRNSEFMNSGDRLEIRVNGPFTRRLGPSNWLGRVFINVLVSRAMGETKDAHRANRLLGVFHSAMDEAIACYRYGEGADDDDSLFACLIPLSGKSTPVRVLDFGEIDMSDHLWQGMVSGTYEIELTE